MGDFEVHRRSDTYRENMKRRVRVQFDGVLVGFTSVDRGLMEINNKRKEGNNEIAVVVWYVLASCMVVVHC